MNTEYRLRFGNYLETLRKGKGKSLRETARAIRVSPQYYSEVEKGRSSTFTAERLKLLTHFLLLDDEEAHTLYDVAAQARSINDLVIPQDCADYLRDHPYAVEALRLSMETGAGEKEWRKFIDQLKARKKELCMKSEEVEYRSRELKNINLNALNMFESKLSEQGLAARTIRSHRNNAELFLNNFLLCTKSAAMNQGCGFVHEFMRDFFIRKCMWSTPKTIRSMAWSLKKFYHCMLAYGEVKQADYDGLCDVIRDNLDDWLADCRQFHASDSSMIK